MSEAGNLDDDALLDAFGRGAFGYFTQYVNRDNGLVPDSSCEGDPCSISAVGFALSTYIVGVERGWISRSDAAELTLAALRFFLDRPQGEGDDAVGVNGFYYHFLDLKTGRRAWKSEASVIDTALLLAGVLLAGQYYDRDASPEREIRARAEAFYRRIDWLWACAGHKTPRQGWNPEGGFIHYDWRGYDEAAVIYVFGLASPTHPLPEGSFEAWTMTYQWESIYDWDYLYAGPLFIHHFSHAWIDFDGPRDRYMQAKSCDYFENSRRATLVQREYARRNPHDFKGYGEHCWGISACKGPGEKVLEIEGRRRSFLGYSARGAPIGPDDGTLAPCATLASLPFTPDLVIRALRHICAHYPAAIRDWRLASGFNPTFPGATAAGWAFDGQLGIDQGIVALMVENYRSRLIWRLMRRCPYVSTGLRRAGFSGGWLR